MDKQSIALMKKMMDSFGPSGFEREINSFVKKEVRSFVDEIFTDQLGTVAFTLNGEGPKVLLTGHTDEVGFIVSSIKARDRFIRNCLFCRKSNNFK